MPLHGIVSLVTVSQTFIFDDLDIFQIVLLKEFFSIETHVAHTGLKLAVQSRVISAGITGVCRHVSLCGIGSGTWDLLMLSHTLGPHTAVFGRKLLSYIPGAGDYVPSPFP